MKKSGFTLVELTVTVLIISIISVALIMVLRGNLNTLKHGQKHMDFNQKLLLGVRRIFYDIKRINPILHESELFGYALKNELAGEPHPRIIWIRKSQNPKDRDELEFVIDSKLDVEDIYNIFYHLTPENRLLREVRDNSGKTTVETVLENVASFTVDNREMDVKQIYVKLFANDKEKGMQRNIEFAVRLETDFVYVDKQDL